MERKIKKYGPSGSMIVGELPTGCKRCIAGEKIVLYTTGQCSVGCPYCPIPEDKQMVDDVYVNEVKVTLDDNELDIIYNESITCIASGAGITGGDPMEVPNRTIKYIKALKTKFGNKYHLHLYTSGKFFINNMDLIDRIFEAGLDELRFHPKMIGSKKIWDIAAKAKTMHPDKEIGFEIPVIPGKEDIIEELIHFADKNNLDFVNLNEYEFTESNFNKLTSRGFVSVLTNSAVSGSMQTAENVINRVKDNVKITVHYCSSGSKDSIQLVQRFKRRASQVKRIFDTISNEGELEYGRFTVNTKDEYNLMLELLETEFDVDAEIREEFPDDYAVETAWYIVDEITSLLREYIPELQAEIIARHPIDNGPITFVDPR